MMEATSGYALLPLCHICPEVALAPLARRSGRYGFDGRTGIRASRLDPSVRLREKDLNQHRDRKVALVVDDEIFARLYAVQILLDEGFTVLEAADAAEGLEVLNRNDAVEILFTDVSMPGEMDGLALINKAREIRPDVALLITSGVMQPVEGDVGRGAKFLPKPYTAHALMRMIRELEAAQ